MYVKISNLLLLFASGPASLAIGCGGTESGMLISNMYLPINNTYYYKVHNGKRVFKINYINLLND